MRNKSLLIVLALLWAFFTTCSVTSYAQSAPRITRQVDERAYVTLPGNTRPEAKVAAYDRGPVANSFVVDHMFLFLQRSPEQEQAIDSYIKQLNDKKSPNFHKWLTPDDLGQKFGVADEDIQQVTNWLQSIGFQINQVYPNKMLIDFSGTVGQIAQAFHTQIEQLSVNGQSHMANLSDPQIPLALAPVIRGFASLNNFPPNARHASAAQYTFAGCATSTSVPTEPGTCYAVTPEDNQTIYNVKPLYQAGYSGQNQTIAVVEDTDVYNYPGDWNTYRSTFGLSSYTQGSFTQVHPNCTDPGTNADDGEAAIDVEVATGIAPSATIELLSCPTNANGTTFGGLIALQNLLNLPGPYPGVVSVSYGVCEAFNGNGGNAAFYYTYQQAAAQGVSVFTSSGDEGASSCSEDFSAGSEYDIASLGVTGWGGTPYDVSVGGTDFEDVYFAKFNAIPLSTYWNATNDANYGSARQYVPEIPWNDACASTLIADYARGSFNTYGASGAGMCNTSPYNKSTSYLIAAAGSGGASNCAIGQGGANTTNYGVSQPGCQGYAKPDFQTGSILQGGNPVYGVPSDGLRDVPDVAMFAANGIWGHFETVCWSDPAYTSDGAASCAGAPSTWSGFGGTSVAAPTMAAIQALVNQRTGQSWGNPLSYYYQIGQNEYGTVGNSFLGSSCNASGTGGPGSGCVFNDVTQGDIDLACRYNGTTTEHHCYKPSTNGADSTDNVTGATVINGGTGYTTAPTCTIAGPTNNQPYLTPLGATLWAGGTPASCTAAVTAASTTAVWTVAMGSVDGVGDQIILSNNDGSVTCGPYTLSGTSTTLMASNLVSSIGSGCALATAASSTSTATITATNAGYAGNFNTNFGSNGTIFQAAYVTITNVTKGQGPNYVSGITIGTAGTGYQPETPITLTGGGGTGAIAVANTTPGTASQSYQPAYGAAPGYDLATGLGTPNAYNLVYSSVWGPVQQPQTITFPNPGPLTYGTSPVTLTATATSGLQVTYTVISGPATVNGSVLTITGAGNVVVEADQAGNANWLAAPPVQDTIVVNQAVLTVTADNKTMLDGGSIPPFTASYSGFVNGDNQGVLSGSPSLTTTYTLNSPPGNYPINAAQGTLMAANYTFTFVNGVLTVTPVTAVITTPVKSSQFGSSNVTIGWSKQSLATSYRLYVGSTPGAYDIAALLTPNLSLAVPNIPTDGRAIYVTLFGNGTGSYVLQDTANYTAANIVKAVITGPNKGSQLTSSTVTFTWSAETGGNPPLSTYTLYVGSTPGAYDIAAFQTSNLTLTVSNIPIDGRQIYVTLYGNAGGVRTQQDTATYTAYATAHITTPVKGSQLGSSNATFGWTAQTGATSYRLYVGSTPGAYDIAALLTPNLSLVVPNIPTDGRAIYVTLFGNAGGSYKQQDTATYTAANIVNAVISGPAKGSQLGSSTATFTWSAETGGNPAGEYLHALRRLNPGRLRHRRIPDVESVAGGQQYSDRRPHPLRHSLWQCRRGQNAAGHCNLHRGQHRQGGHHWTGQGLDVYRQNGDLHLDARNRRQSSDQPLSAVRGQHAGSL